MSYVYVRSEPQLFTVGFYTPEGKWEAESDHATRAEAAARVNFLNGGEPPPRVEVREANAMTPERMLNIAKGCLDYGGGHRADDGKLEIFHHGIQTVINSLEAALAGPTDQNTQVAALERIGRGK